MKAKVRVVPLCDGLSFKIDVPSGEDPKKVFSALIPKVEKMIEILNSIPDCTTLIYQLG